jgi:hypothetical protein
MSRKSYNDIEKIIKDLAEAHEPAFDEQAWLKMEILLDKEKDRRKPFFWLWWVLPILIATGVGSYFIFYKMNTEIQHPIAVKNNILSTVESSTVNTTDETILEASPKAGAEKLTGGLNNRKPDVDNAPTSKNSHFVTGNINSSISTRQDRKTQKNNAFASAGKQLSDNTKGKVKLTIKGTAAAIDPEKKEVFDDTLVSAIKLETVGRELKEEPSTIYKDAVTKESSPPFIKASDTVSKNIRKDHKIKNRNSKFYFIAAAGAEANAVKLFSFQKITARAGLAIGYQVTPHLSVQTGFYSSSKKYVAGPEDYKAKPGSYWGSVDITKIEANCLVYEIPLLLRYDLTTNKKINIFSSASLSSYLMKKEDYHYYYYRYGASHEASASYKGNQHLFSVLRFSAGVEKKISKQFSLNAAPGLAIPLAGVGEGQVKLFSTDLMVGLKFTPLSKKIK